MCARAAVGGASLFIVFFGMVAPPSSLEPSPFFFGWTACSWLPGARRRPLADTEEHG